jgi:hypothetical protein
MDLWSGDSYVGQDMNGLFFAGIFYNLLEDIINAYENKRFRND